MIVGIGTDIVTVSRMAENLERMGDRFARRLLTETEYKEYEKKHNGAAYLAKRFAAKEAAVKAMGTGFAEGITWKHVAVCNDDKGAPFLELSGPASDKAKVLGVVRAHLSISDEKEHAVAFVILES
ncbi:MAG: holo-ACP synthase [Pseudomonadales bacterium]|jgi:holo-[acyl-carrier protein] synthase|uniref:holo-ACP synthase n=1 Tax=unclassified Ketobacter TaxID=2639109 RepID=UPI000C35DFB3|nr:MULTISPECIES: holo-ACP synthase [unclassified Ketobacter]MAA59412.1 holo-ACP synthase [Pseudomonadales bacterium]MEC8813666.1 holo-ACP synthase [Pseudomonadota bacterium]TNC89615.1 MAG: holo-ACP synthase [Alcanivorax sp.]HAU13308.1 holo-ACP synthase [Gammaproteobacteria bacterium]MAQ27145.1 holo-ACP synthase [Pseudomonadales bacterium]|tara:strand:- start:173 stop:550 length:378 start_codon:yes stop_codon:yes gene_type:complete